MTHPAVRRTALVLGTAALATLPRADGALIDRPRLEAPTTTTATTPAAPAAPGTTGTPRERNPLSETVTLRRTTVAGKVFTYCGNGSVDRPPAQATRVIFMIHGNDRHSCAAAQAIAASGGPALARRTLIIAPRFPTLDDRVNGAADLHWSFYGWSQGDPSLNDDARVSSYAVMDELVDRVGIADRVVAGFSGGGQFVNRYAAGSARDATRFVIANPSSYLYFGPERPGSDPALVAACPGYDNYRYGLRQPNAYMALSDPETLRRRYTDRPIAYLLGDADTDPLSPSMDKECGAKVQGINRWERGRRYWAYLPTALGPRVVERQSMSVVRGVAHDGFRMMADPAARHALFE